MEAAGKNEEKKNLFKDNWKVILAIVIVAAIIAIFLMKKPSSSGAGTEIAYFPK